MTTAALNKLLCNDLPSKEPLRSLFDSRQNFGLTLATV